MINFWDAPNEQINKAVAEATKEYNYQLSLGLKDFSENYTPIEHAIHVIDGYDMMGDAEYYAINKLKISLGV